MKLSIVTTLYQSAPYIKEFYQRASTAAQQLFGDDYEIIFVNDGSPDSSLEIAVNLTKKDDKVLVIDLSRNFGHHKAMMTGLSHTRGELVFLIDCDLEEAPEWLLDFSQKMNQEQCDVVYGAQKFRRKDHLSSKVYGSFFYSLFNFLSETKITKNLVTARLMTKRYVQALILHKERELLIAGLWASTGYHQEPFFIEKKKCKKTTYTFSKKISLVVNSITAFSSKPLTWIFYTGIIISTLALTLTVYLISQAIFFTKPLTGWTSVMVSIWLLGGIIISFIGIVGIYLSKVFIEVKQRPYTTIRQIYGRSK